MIEYINYKKKKYPVRIAYIALKGFKKDTGMSFEEIGEGNADLEVYESLLYHSMVAGAKADDSEMTFEKKHMELILDECFMEFLGLFPKFFPDTEEAGKPKPNRKQRRAK